MDSTLEKKKYKKLNWKYVRINDRDIRLFQLILEQKFLTRPQVIKHVFRNKRYAKTRIWKLKTFAYLQPVLTLAREPESYLLGRKGVEALRMHGYEMGKCDLPKPQQSIEVATYKHDRDVSEVRFLLEKLGFCKDWHSEKMLRLGMTGERKVPDGYFRTKKSGVAVEVEFSDKKTTTYEKIFNIYGKDPRIDYVLYVCGDDSIMELMMRLIKAAGLAKPFCCILFEKLMRFREKAVFNLLDKEFTIKEILEK